MWTLRKRFHIDERIKYVVVYELPGDIALLKLHLPDECFARVDTKRKYVIVSSNDGKDLDVESTDRLYPTLTGYKNYGGFSKDKRSSFKYWFAHWCAFNMTALRLGIWRPKYLLHDFEKPWLMLMWKDYKRVQQWHRKHNNHHIEWLFEHNMNWDKFDWTAMVIDWECSGFTKTAAAWDAREQLERECERWTNESVYIRLKVQPIIDSLKI